MLGFMARLVSTTTKTPTSGEGALPTLVGLSCELVGIPCFSSSMAAGDVHVFLPMNGITLALGIFFFT